jgi:hypothetical protein
MKSRKTDNNVSFVVHARALNARVVSHSRNRACDNLPTMVPTYNLRTCRCCENQYSSYR